MKRITRKDKKSFLAPFGLLLIVLAVLILILSEYYEKKSSIIRDVQVDEYISETSLENLDKADKEDLSVEQVSEKYDYIAVLEIESINLKRGLVAYDSKYNSVKYNIQILDNSNMPDVKNGNLILAAHNGTSSVSFFNNLSLLKEGDTINVYYDGYKYVYKYTNSYEVDKNGMVQIIRDRMNNAITLITCKDNSDTKQVVYVGYFIEKTEY